jgi:cellulose synthase catalytic subunit (UDP-forming)
VTGRSHLWREFESGGGLLLRALRFAVVAGGGAFLCVAVFLPMGWPSQAALALAVLLAALWTHRSSRSRLATLAVVWLSVFSTARYAVWRVSAVTAFFRDPGSNAAPLDVFFTVALLAAEAYAFAVLLLGYMQTAWPLQRAPAPLPDDPGEWPAVDVLIPTLNEPLDLVRYTALAAVAMDWPVEKLKVWLLDDGSREDFRAFAEAAGIGYLARGDNHGAKAGNINHALRNTSAPLVAVFDCDHAPTRSFLQMTVGWFLRDEKMALVQTPHRFYSQSPFERNLAGFREVPGEEQLFHGAIQDGNDLWNAASFAGSCAVLRRDALNEVGGLATETVTEDVHTSLRLQKRGWNAAYINIPQAAGLATERLSDHVQQHVRWARGMMQALRLEDLLFGGALRWQQRLCYLNEAAYFLSALPRLIFLMAPAVYLMFGRTALPGLWATIIAYVTPHLLLASLAHTRIYGRQRQTFWNEIYETVMAPYILLPTLAALVNPRRARFRVTAKGGVVEREFYDWRTAWPYLLLLGWNFAALACAGVRLAPAGFAAVAGLKWIGAISARVPWLHAGGAGAVWINVAWAVFNVAVLGVAAGAARESAQRRRSVRVTVAVPADVVLAGGAMVQGVTCDLSAGGARVKIAEAQAKPGDAIEFILPLLDGAVTLPATVVSLEDGELRARFGALGLKEADALTTLLYSRADAWLGWGEAAEPDSPVRGVGRLLRLAVGAAWRIVGRGRRKEPAALLTNIAPLLAIALLLVGAGRSARAGQTANNTSAVAAAHAQATASAKTSAIKTAPVVNDLALLPRPFFDPAATEHKPVAIVFLAAPSRKAIQAAGIVASWFGVESGEAPLRFAVSNGTIPSAGNAIVFVERAAQVPPALQISAIAGPMVALRANPGDPGSSVLLIAGTDADQLLTAATALALNAGMWQGAQELVKEIQRPAPRAPDDAPRWLRTDRAATFAQARIETAGGELQGDGSQPLTATLRLPPDLDYRDRQDINRNLALHLDYRYNAVPLAEGSTLQVYVNGAYVSSTPMPHTDRASEVLETVVPVPVVDLRPGENEFMFRFAFHASAGAANSTRNLIGAVLRDSYLDIAGIPHWTELPELSLLARAGYPFTRRADLADTAIVLADAPSTHEVEALLALMAHFGAQTGLPAVNVTVTDASAIDAGAGKDLIVLGTPQDQPAIAKLDASLPVGVSAEGLRVQAAEGVFGGFGRSFVERIARWRGGVPDAERFGEIETAGQLPDATVEEMEWPRGSGRTVVVIALRDDAASAGFVDAFERAAPSQMAQSVSVLRAGRFSSYRLGDDGYWTGAISPWKHAEFLLEDSPWLVAMVVAIVCFLFAVLLQARLRRRARERLQVAA